VNLASIIDGHPDDAVAIVSRGKKLTYGGLRRQVAGARGGIQRLGVGVGDRVAIACANNPTFVVAYLAALGAGCVAVPVNPSSPAYELDRAKYLRTQKELNKAANAEIRTRRKMLRAVGASPTGRLPEQGEPVEPEPGEQS